MNSNSYYIIVLLNDMWDTHADVCMCVYIIYTYNSSQSESIVLW